MKRVSRILAVVALSLFVGGIANAQIKVGVGGGIQLPIGDFGDENIMGAKIGFGGGVSGEYMVNENIGVGVSGGYYMFGGPEAKFEEEGIKMELSNSYSLIPIVANAKYYFATEGFKPYGGVDVGIYMFGVTSEVSVLGISQSATASTTEFGAAPVFGFQYDFSDALALDVNAKFNMIFATGTTLMAPGLNVGIVYSFGK